MDKEHSEGAADAHIQAEKKLDMAESAVRKALDQLKDVSRDLKHRIVGEDEHREYPVDDDAPGDIEEEAPPTAQRLENEGGLINR